MFLCDMQKFKSILQSNVIINILASKFFAWIQKDGLSSSSFQISSLLLHEYGSYNAMHQNRKQKFLKGIFYTNLLHWV